MPDYTQADYEREWAELDAHIAAIKRRRDLPKLSVDDLVAEYLLVDGQHEALGRVMYQRCRAIWANKSKEARNVWRRANWHKDKTHYYLVGIKAELLGRGEAGIAGIKRLFVAGDARLTMTFARDAEIHFPDAAEPVLEALLASPDFVYRELAQDLLTRIRGYRARGPAALDPAIALNPDAGLAPALTPTPGAPTAFPALLLARIATNVFTGRMGYQAALLEAWAWVAEDRRLDPAEIDRAECATFDFAILDAIKRELWDLCPDHAKRYAWPIDTPAVPYGLGYLDACARPVTRAELVEAMWHAAMAPEWPYEAAASWHRVR